MNNKLNWLVDTYIAHRGLHSNDANCPENSIPAFQKAMDRGFAIELDVHLLLDGNVVVFHDNNLLRMSGVDKPVENCSTEEIKRLKLLSSNNTIPLLKEVLEVVHGQVPLLIETKSEGRIGNLESALLKILKQYKGKYALQSFNPFSMKWFRVNAPNIRRGQLSGNFKNTDMAFYKKFLFKNLLLNCISRPSFINYDITYLPNPAVDRQRKKGLIILGWTARSIEQYNRAKKWCDNIIFEGFEPER